MDGFVEENPVRDTSLHPVASGESLLARGCVGRSRFDESGCLDRGETQVIDRRRRLTRASRRRAPQEQSEREGRMFTRLYDKVRETPMWLPTVNGNLYAVECVPQGSCVATAGRDCRARTGKSTRGPRARW